MKDAKWNMILIASLLVVGGLFLIIFPEIAADTVGYVLGACLMGVGLVKVVLYFTAEPELGFYHFGLLTGLTLMVIGFMIILNVRKFLELLPLCLGLIVLLSGILKIQHGINLLRYNARGWMPVLIWAALGTILGVLLILNPFGAVKTLVVFLGIGFLFSGLTDLATTLIINRVMKREEKDFRAHMDAHAQMEHAKHNVVDVVDTVPTPPDELPFSK